MTEQELREKTPLELAVMAAEAMGWTICYEYGLHFRKIPDGELLSMDLHWNPTTDANQAIELAESVRRQVAGGLYLTESTYDGAYGGSNHDVTFYWDGYDESAKASDPSFPLALTLASLLAWDAVKVEK